ncbi:MAG TPA: phosphate signaling complex protein PhoU [Myxococcaceae bacterium]|nr:phosphate signaling complex protein PhoU [Myxococcaceae bacterium]
MTRTRFNEGLEELKEHLLRMAKLAEESIGHAVKAYSERDPLECERVANHEPEIDAAQREVDELARDLLAMQQPVAVDLRFILAVIKINADLERVGDHAMNIARLAEQLLQLPAAELPVDIARMGDMAAGMVRQALDAFVLADVTLAQKVLAMDDDVDRMDREIAEAMVDLIRKAPGLSEQGLDAVVIAHNLERIADHATNIAEDVIFWVQGADVRHQREHP